MMDKMDEIIEISKNAGMRISYYGSRIFMGYNDVDLAWIVLDTSPILSTVTGYDCNIETEDLEVIRQQINEAVKKFKEYNINKMKARIEDDFE